MLFTRSNIQNLIWKFCYRLDSPQCHGVGHSVHIRIPVLLSHHSHQVNNFIYFTMKATSIAIALTATLGSVAATDDTPKYYIARNMVGQNGFCYNENACKTACQQLGLPSPLGGQWPTKGCFAKNGKAYYSEGSVDQKSDQPPGVQARIYCGMPAELPETTSRSGEYLIPPAVVTDGTVCRTKEECKEAAGSIGITTFSALGVEDQQRVRTKGCFTKNGKAFFGSQGSDEEMSETELPGIQQRIWCSPTLSEYNSGHSTLTAGSTTMMLNLGVMVATVLFAAHQLLV